MYNIDSESIKKLKEVNILLNQLEIRGISNISLLYKTMLLLQEIGESIDKNTQNIVINEKK